MGSLFDAIEAGGGQRSQPLRHEVSIFAATATEPVAATAILTVNVAATATREPILTNKEYIEFLRDYYSAPPEHLASQPLRTVAATATKRIKHSCKQCGWNWESFNSDPKRCSSCGSHYWR